MSDRVPAPNDFAPLGPGRAPRPVASPRETSSSRERRTIMLPSRRLAVPENRQWLPVLNSTAEEPKNSRETQPFLATSNQPIPPKVRASKACRSRERAVVASLEQNSRRAEARPRDPGISCQFESTDPPLEVRFSHRHSLGLNVH